MVSRDCFQHQPPLYLCLAQYVHENCPRGCSAVAPYSASCHHGVCSVSLPLSEKSAFACACLSSFHGCTHEVLCSQVWMPARWINPHVPHMYITSLGTHTCTRTSTPLPVHTPNRSVPTPLQASPSPPIPPPPGLPKQEGAGSRWECLTSTLMWTWDW